MNLTPSQQTLVTATAPRVIAIAGPGAGKTTTLVARYCHHSGGPVIIVTFTNAAADHLKAKIAATGTCAPDFCGTLHALALRILHRTRPTLTLLDEDQAEELMRDAIAETKAKTSTKALREIINGQRTASQVEKVAVMRYRAKLASHDAEDFDTLLLVFLEMLRESPARIGHLMVDEYQDSGTLDHAIYQAMHCEKAFFVGDVNQSIYAFRGARLENLVELADSPDSFTGFMEENFRCGIVICSAANSLISHNRQRGDNLTKSATGTQGNVQALKFESEGIEEQWICETAKAMPGTTAVLVRYNADAARITKALEASGAAVAQTPATELPGDWKLAMAMLKLTASPENQLHAFAFLSATIGKDKAAAERVAAISNARKLKPWEAPDAIPDAMERLKLSREMRALLVAAWKAVGSPTRWPDHATEMALWLQQEIAAPQAKTQGIEVMTIHKAKGLEFDNVIISGLEEGTLPGSDVEESRRLLYVAITRARHNVFLTACEKRLDPYRKKITERTTSRFITELS